MEKELAMPKLRPEMTSGVLCAWLKEEGDQVEAGEPLYEVETDKVVNQIEANASGERLRHYMDSFGDPGIYVAGELGIGLNKKSRCVGNCYIEDESAFTTFHIGMGRNLALGGVHDAAGHFDLVFQFPTIYADDILIMKDGFPAV